MNKKILLPPIYAMLRLSEKSLNDTISAGKKTNTRKSDLAIDAL